MNNPRSNIIKQLRRENLHLLLRNISKKKRYRKQYKRNKDNGDKRGIRDDRKREKLNKLHENDLSGGSLEESFILKADGKFLIEDKNLIEKIKLSQKIYNNKKLEEEKLKKKKK